MGLTQIESYALDMLQPVQNPADARLDAVAWGPNLVVTHGQAVAIKTADKLTYPYSAQLTTPTNATFTTAATGGSLASATTYYYRVSAINGAGETLASPETSLATAAGTATNTVTVKWAAIPGATGYKVYGRSTAAEALIATVADGSVTSYTDTGAITPAGALPAATNEVQTMAPTGTASAGTFDIGILRPTGVVGQTGPVAYTASLATIQTALDLASGVVNGVVATSAASAAPFTTPTPLILTFSGTGYAGLPQSQKATIDTSGLTGATVVTVTRTTAGSAGGSTIASDGTQNCVGLAQYSFITDAAGLVYKTNVVGTASPTYRLSPDTTSPIFTCGTFDPAELIGFDAAAQTNLKAHTLHNGFIKIP